MTVDMYGINVKITSRLLGHPATLPKLKDEIRDVVFVVETSTSQTIYNIGSMK